MIEIKRILCPVDFSEFSRHALEHGLVLARWYGAEVTVLHAFPMPPAPVIAGYPEPMPLPTMQVSPPELTRQAEASLKRFVETLDASALTLHLKAEAGDGVQQILAAAETLPADLIVLGTHGRSGVDRLVLGSVAEKVLRKAACPVLTVPPPVSGAAGATLVFERILCPIDFSEPSMRALAYALSLAQEADASLLLMHVVEALPLVSSDLYPHFDVVGYQQALMDSARERLRSSVPEEARVWCRPEEIVTTGKAYPEILRAARERQADLVVMGVHGRNPIDLMLFGSTTQHIVRQARCPVLTLRS